MYRADTLLKPEDVTPLMAMNYPVEPECIEEHLFGSPAIVPAMKPITFNEVSAFKQKKGQDGRAHSKKPAGKGKAAKKK